MSKKKKTNRRKKNNLWPKKVSFLHYFYICNFTYKNSKLVLYAYIPLSINEYINYLNFCFIPACKDRNVVDACVFDQNGKWEWLRKSKLHCKSNIPKLMQEWVLAMLLADSITSMKNSLIFFFCRYSTTNK